MTLRFLLVALVYTFASAAATPKAAGELFRCTVRRVLPEGMLVQITEEKKRDSWEKSDRQVLLVPADPSAHLDDRYEIRATAEGSRKIIGQQFPSYRVLKAQRI